MTRPEATTAAFYDELWRRGEDAENASRRSLHEPLVRRALDRLGDVRGKTVLEIGPGAGHETALLVERGARVVAVDLAPSALVRTREVSRGRASGAVARAEALPLADGSVDAVFAQTVLMHLDVERTVAEWARVLRPGGRAVVLEPLAGNPFVGLYRRWLSPYRATRPRYLTVARLAGASSRLALVRHEEHFVTAPVALAFPQAVGRRLAALLGAADRALLAVPGVRRLAWMTLAELELR